MDSWAFILIISLVLVIILTLVFLFWYSKRRFFDIPYNCNIAFSFLPGMYTDEHHVFYEVDSKTNENGDSVVKVVPIDVFQNPDKTNLKVQQYDLVVKRGRRKIISKGDKSGYRNIIWYFPYDFRELPQEIKDTEFGAILLDLTYLEKERDLHIQQMRYIESGLMQILTSIERQPTDLIIDRVDDLIHFTKQAVARAETPDKSKKDTVGVY